MQLGSHVLPCRGIPAQRKRFGSSAKLSRRVPRSCRPRNNGQSRQLLFFLRAFSTLYSASPAPPSQPGSTEQKSSELERLCEGEPALGSLNGTNTSQGSTGHRGCQELWTLPTPTPVTRQLEQSLARPLHIPHQVFAHMGRDPEPSSLQPDPSQLPLPLLAHQMLQSHGHL